MKCKKILAMLLALCMVLSTFVAVSAADVVVVDIYEDYEDGIGDTLYGGDVTIATEEFEGENVLVATKAEGSAAGWQNLVGFAVTDAEGNQLTQDVFPEEGTVEYSFDIYVPAEGGNVGDATFYLRTGNSFPPSGRQSALNELNGLTTGTWQTFEGTITDLSSFAWASDTAAYDMPVWICLRPNFSGAGKFYLDNVSFTLSVPGEEEEEPELPPVSGGIEFELAPKNVAGTLEDGVYTVTSEQIKAYAGNTTDYSNCSAIDWLKITPTTELDPEKTIKVSYEIKAENLVNSVGQPYANRETTLRIRNAQNDNVVPRTTYLTMVPVNTGSAELVEFEIPVASIEGYDHFGISLDMMNAVRYGDGSEYFEISNVAIEYVGEEEEPELPPVTPEEPEEPEVPEVPADEITYSLTRVVNAGTNGGNAYPSVGEVNEDVFTATLRNVREYTYDRNGGNESAMGGDCDYQPWVAIMLDEDLETSDDWYVSFDLTTDGIVNSVGAEYETLTVRTRFYNGNTEICNHSDHKIDVAANSGEPVNVGVQVDTSKVTGPVTKIGIAVAVGTSVKYNEYVGSVAYFTIDNIEVAMGEYVAPEDEEPDEPVVPPVTPEEPDEPEVPEEAIFTTEIPNGNSVTTEADGVYTVTVADVYNNMTAGATNSYNGYVAVIPTTPIALDEDWTVTYDLTTNGLTPGSADIWLRLLDNTATAAQGRTLGYVKQSATKADGTVTYTFTSEDIENGGGTSTATEIAAIYITFNMAPERAAYAEAPFDGYIEFSNISFEYGLPESEEPDEPVVPPVTPEEPGEIEYFNVIEINAPLDDASEITMIGQNVTVENATDIGGRSNVVKASGVGNSNNNIVGLKIGGSDFAFQPGDTIRYSVDVYLTSNATPNLWLRRHTGGMEPFNDNFKPALGAVTAGQWVTITHECAFENLGTYDVAKAPQGWETPGDYALYLRADLGTVYLDNFSITVEREFVATIESVELVEAGADNATFRVTADGAIDIDTIAAAIDGVEVDVTAEVEDELNTLVTVTGFAPNTEYTFAVTGAKNPNDRDVAVADEAACTVNFTTIAEVDAEAGLARDTFTYTLTNNLAETETIYVVLLRCKGNTVVDTISVPVEAVSGEPVEGSIEVAELENGEYYRFFAWTYENDMINSMANLIDLD